MRQNRRHENVNLLMLRRFAKNELVARLRKHPRVQSMDLSLLIVIMLNPALLEIGNEPVQTVMHPRDRERRPLDNNLITISVRPVINLSAPIPRIAIHALHLIAREQLINSSVHLRTRDAPTPLLRVPPRGPIIRPIRRREHHTIRSLSTNRAPVARSRTIKPERNP